MADYKKVTILDEAYDQLGYSPIAHCFSVSFNYYFVPDSPDKPDTRMKQMTVHGKQCTVVVRIHSEEEDDPKELDERPKYAHLKLLETDTFLVVFSVKSRKGFKQTEEEWIPKIRSYFPDAPIIIVANDVEARVSDQRFLTVSAAEVYNMAKKLGTSYCEISAERGQGVNDCFHHAVELAMINKKRFKAKYPLLNKATSFLRRSSAIIPPLKPLFGPEPIIRALPPSFIDDWTQHLSNPKFHDIRLLVGEDKYLYAHRAILCSAPSVFRTLLSTGSSPDTRNNSQKDEVKGVFKIYNSPDGGELTVELSADIKAKAVVKVLEFMYTGFLSKDFNDANVEDVKHVAQLFELNELAAYCDKVLACQDFEKKDLKDFTDSQKKISMKELLKEGNFSDMDFVVKGIKIPAHKFVMCARSSAMAALIDSTPPQTGSHLKIPLSNTSVVCFKQFLEFLYTDEVPLVNASRTTIGLMSIAHEYGAQRLVGLCEMLLKVELEKMFKILYRVDTEMINAIDLLNRYKACHALQMVDWCRHYISYNFDKFYNREEFKLLDQEDQDYIKKYQWPPVSYTNEMIDFLKKHPL